jgi:hypothetical protein
MYRYLEVPLTKYSLGTSRSSHSLNLRGAKFNCHPRLFEWSHNHAPSVHGYHHFQNEAVCVPIVAADIRVVVGCGVSPPDKYQSWQRDEQLSVDADLKAPTERYHSIGKSYS